MFLVEMKLGDFKIRKYILTLEELDILIQENPQYEYIKIIKEVQIEKEEKIRRKKR